MILLTSLILGLCMGSGVVFSQLYGEGNTEKLKTVTPNSVIHYHAVIYQALKYAMKTDMVPQNVAMKVDRPRKNSFQPTFLDAEQMQKLFEIVKGTRLELPALVAAFYGLRRGEVLGLKWDER